ncbi:hypothetical protein MC885_008346, partial [Smutsia gigantea]
AEKGLQGQSAPGSPPTRPLEGHRPIRRSGRGWGTALPTQAQVGQTPRGTPGGRRGRVTSPSHGLSR